MAVRYTVDEDISYSGQAAYSITLYYSSDCNLNIPLSVSLTGIINTRLLSCRSFEELEQRNLIV